MFPASLEFHVAPWIDALVRWLLLNWGSAFDALANGILRILVWVQYGLEAIPWWLWFGLVAGFGWWLTRRPGTTFGLTLLLFTIGIFGLWAPALETLAVVIASVVIALLLGIPLGILMAESRRLNAAITPVLDAMQTMPSFVYLIPALMFFSLGKVPAVLATVIYALPPVVRLTNLGIRQVAEDAQEAANAFGATRWQLLWEVRLPLAVPSILAGVNQTTMMALAMVVIASMIGARGLGEYVLRAINRLAVGDGVEAGFAVVALAIIMDRLTQGFARRWEPPSH